MVNRLGDTGREFFYQIHLLALLEYHHHFNCWLRRPRPRNKLREDVRHLRCLNYLWCVRLFSLKYRGHFQVALGEEIRLPKQTQNYQPAYRKTRTQQTTIA